jgi:hypothetical protein
MKNSHCPALRRRRRRGEEEQSLTDQEAEVADASLGVRRWEEVPRADFKFIPIPLTLIGRADLKWSAVRTVQHACARERTCVCARARARVLAAAARTCEWHERRDAREVRVARTGAQVPAHHDPRTHSPAPAACRRKHRRAGPEVGAALRGPAVPVPSPHSFGCSPSPSCAPVPRRIPARARLLRLSSEPQCLPSRFATAVGGVAECRLPLRPGRSPPHSRSQSGSQPQNLHKPG